MANELDIVAGGAKLSMTGSSSPPLTISETLKAKIKSKPKRNKLIDGNTLQHGQTFDVDVDIWDTGFDLLTELKNRRDERLDVTLISPVSVHLFKGVNIMVSEDKSFESSPKAHKLKVEFGLADEANVTASIRNILRETGSMNTADPTNPQMPIGWASGGNPVGVPSIAANPSSSDNALFWNGATGGRTFQLRKQFPIAGKFITSYGFRIIPANGTFDALVDLEFFDNSNSTIFKDTTAYSVGTGTTKRFVNTLNVSLPTQSADVQLKFTINGVSQDFYIDDVQIEMGDPTSFVPR